MTDNVDIQPFKTIIILASMVIIIGGMKTASSILLPFLVSIFLALIVWPLVVWLHDSRLPNILSFPVILTIFLTFVVGIGYYIGNAANRFVEQIPSYRSAFNERFSGLVDTFNSLSSRFGIEFNSSTLGDLIQYDQLFGYLGGTLGTLGSILSNSFLVLLIFAFVLGEFHILPGKVRGMLNRPHADLSRFGQISTDVQKYMGVKTMVSAISGVIAGTGCFLIGLPFAPLWGIIVFLLNYVPSIGSILAAIPPITLAFVLFGVWHALAVLAVYISMEILMGSIIEPRLQGETLGLSTFIVFASLVFWGWVFGPVGMILSVPLTMVAKIVLENHEDTRWIAIMLGGRYKNESSSTS